MYLYAVGSVAGFAAGMFAAALILKPFLPADIDTSREKLDQKDRLCDRCGAVHFPGRLFAADPAENG